jgi:diguanylate cyclase (GGDEF)-like protein
LKFFSKLGGNRQQEGINPESLRRATRPEGRKDRPSNADELREQAERLHELAVLSLFLHSAGTLEEMLSLFLERAPRVTGAIVTYPLLLDRRRDVLSAQRLATVEDAGLEQASMAAEETLADLEFPMPLRSFRRTLMEGGEVVLTDDLREILADGLSRQACDQIRARLEITRVGVVPLVMEGETFGLCVFMFSGTQPDVEILELAAGHCTLALKALMAGEETTRYGGIDAVTWAHSRGYFLEALESEVVRARRFGRGLSLVFFDIDDFGAFNTNYGHTLGDRLLRSVSMTLSSSIAMPELVARYGADEFALLLPESNRAAAVEITARIIDRINSLSVLESGKGERIGCSVSVAIVSCPEDGGSREELLAAAEVSLEMAKEDRRAAMRPTRSLSPVQQLRLAGRRHNA